MELINAPMRKQNRPKKQPQKDWHQADIVAALRKKGWSLSQLSLHHGYKNRCTLKIVNQRPWPAGEKMIADVLNLCPCEIWPSRYPDHPNDPNGKCTKKDKKAAA